jgi:hypothetical protein
MAEVFRRKTMELTAGLQHDGQRDAARLALRGFVEKILIPPPACCPRCRSSQHHQAATRRVSALQ